MQTRQQTIVALIVVVALSELSSTASAVAVTSNDFSLGYGYSDGTNQWNDTEVVTPGVNIGVVGDFTLSVNFDPNVSFTSGNGVLFTDRVLIDTGPGQSQGRSSTFGVSLTATYTGSEPLIATRLVIDSIRIYAGNWNAASVSNTPGPDFINWAETTVGNSGTSALLNLGAAVADPSLVSSYDQLVWDPEDVAVPGITSTRVFALGVNGDLNAYLDGFEVLGHIETVPPAPEPSSLLLLGLGSLGLVRHTRRRRRRRRA